MSNRVAFAVIATITVLLLFGSLVLQNIYFKADQVSSSLFISPTTFSRKPNSKVDLQIKANVEGTAVVAGSQFIVEFDPKVVKFIDAEPVSPWQTLKIASDARSVTWALLPKTDQGVTIQVSKEVTFGTLSFTTLADGQATIRIKQEGSTISAIDSSKSPSLYNAITSTQDSSGVISESGEASSDQAQVLSETTEILPVFATQKVLRNDPIVSAEAAKLLVSLKYLGGITVKFGTTSDLPLTIETSETSLNHLINFSALSADTRYFYQVIVNSPDKKSSLKTQVRSFVTAESGGAAIDAKTTKVVVFPELSKQSSSIIVSPRDSAEKISLDPITLEVVSGEAKIESQTTSNGIVTARVVSQSAAAQKATISVRSGDQIVTNAVAQFDPTIAEASEPTFNFSQPIRINQTNAMLMFLIAAGMIMFGFLFIRLAKSK